MNISQPKISNILLHTMAAGDFRLLEPHFQRIHLPAGLQLHGTGRAIDYVYFPEDGIVSIISGTPDGKLCEVGLFGREGMSGTAAVMGAFHSPHDAYVQANSVLALRLSAFALNRAMAQSGTMRLHLLKYVQAMMIQFTSSIAAASQTIEQRLARWLLMCHDRLDDDKLLLTHEFIGIMMGVRRAGVTLAMEKMGRQNLITTRRGSITVDDRTRLESLADGGYGLAEAEYERLFGIALRRDRHAP